jgi:transposase-like protein
LLLDLKRRGLAMGPELAVADGALGFWQAVEQVWPQTRGQRCWVHKTANALNKLPKSQHSKAKRALQEIWMAETKKDALAAFDAIRPEACVRLGRRLNFSVSLPNSQAGGLPCSRSIRRNWLN